MEWPCFEIGIQKYQYNGNLAQVDSIRNSISNLGFNPQTFEATLGYRWIDEIIKSVQSRAKTSIWKKITQ
ncbi:MAG: hypothetical protein CM1200mP10_24480 [Candidatus Neomarinimicrobiota bacterium]|nr:MAG: hypothetical protein CM1200mP10_24480 [Candidatus Neomarinimicrobiota bacterium]